MCVCVCVCEYLCVRVGAGEVGERVEVPVSSPVETE